jgi:hypothetical protein
MSITPRPQFVLAVKLPLSDHARFIFKIEVMAKNVCGNLLSFIAVISQITLSQLLAMHSHLCSFVNNESKLR